MAVVVASVKDLSTANTAGTGTFESLQGSARGGREACSRYVRRAKNIKIGYPNHSILGYQKDFFLSTLRLCRSCFEMSGVKRLLRPDIKAAAGTRKI